MKIFLIGFMGSGKTHWGKIWANRYGLQFFDHDEMIEQREQKTIDAIFERYGEDLFREKESALLKTFFQKDNAIIACGGGAPCFFDNMQWMNENGITIYLKATPAQIAERVINEKDKRPLLKKLNNGELLSFIEQKLTEREPFYNQAKIILPIEVLNTDSLLTLNP